MAILQITPVELGGVGVIPRNVKMVSTDNFYVLTSPGYIDNARNLGYTFSPTDVFEVLYNYSRITGIGDYGFFLPSITNNIVTLVPDASEGNVELPVVEGNFAVFANNLGIIRDGGTPGEAAYKNVSDVSKDNVASIDPAVTFATDDILVSSDSEGTIKSSGVSISDFFIDPMTTKGDLITRDATQAVRLPIGSDGSILQSDSTQATGNGWSVSLNDSSLLPSISFQARQLFAADGTTVMFDYGIANHTLIGPSGNARVDIVGGGFSTVLFEVDSTDPNAGMTFMTNGAGSYDFTSGTTTLLFLGNQAGAVNNFNMFAATTGNAPIFTTDGDDADVSMHLQAKGAGVIFSNNPISAFAGLRVSEAANSKQGTATLTGGTVTVANTSVTANSRIFLTAQDNNSVGSLRISARTAGISFDITSSVNTDNGVVAFEIFEPA